MIGKSIVLSVCFLFSAVVPTAWSVSVEVNKAGDDSVVGGPYKTIQAAIDFCQSADDGPDVVTITDSGLYEENFVIGNEDQGGTPVELTSNKTGDERPVISPLVALGPFFETHRDPPDRMAGTAIYSNGSKLSNVILESNPEAEGQTGNGSSALHILANDVIVENVLIRPRAGTAGETKYPNSGIFLAQEGYGGVPEPNGRMCDDVVIRNCDFIGVAADGQTEPTAESPDGFLLRGDNGGPGQFATFVRCDAFTDSEDMSIDVTFDNCTFRYSYDAGLFPSNRGSAGVGQINWYVRDCFFDAFGKFALRSRGCNLFVERSIFSRACQGNHGDGENSAVAIQAQGGNVEPTAEITNCLFVNCGGVYSKRAYYGGVNNHNGGVMKVNHCTFDLCNNGVTVNTMEARSELYVSNCLFNRIGYNQAPAIWYDGFPPETSDPFVTWDSENYSPNISAVFNNYNDGDALLKVSNCIVNGIADEDSTPWEEFVDITGCRLTAGTVEGLDTVIRTEHLSVPMFANTDIHAANPYELSEFSPAIDKAVSAEPAPGELDLDGTARIVVSVGDIGAQEFPGSAVGEWSLF